MAKIIGKIRKPSGRYWYHLCYHTTDFSDILVNGVSVGKITSVEGLSEEEAAQEIVYNVEYILKSSVISTQGTFQGIYMLEEAKLYGITETSQYCFSGAGIKSLYIDGSLSNLNNNTFIYCPLEHIEIDPSNQKYVSEGGCLIRKSTLGDFLHYGTSNAVIPDSVTSIGSYAFYKKSFETIEIPRSVKTLNSSIFEGSKLKYITIPDSVNYMWVSVFKGCDYLKYVNFGDETNHNFNFTYTWGRSMFDDCPNLERINFYGDTLPETYNNETNGYENTFYGMSKGGVLGVKEGVDTTPWFSGEYNLGTYNWTVGEIEIPELEYTYTMVYDVNTTDEIYLFGSTKTSLGEGFHTLSELDGWVKTIYIDGVDVGITPTYSFSSTGEHSVVLVTSGFNLPNQLFYYNEYLTSIIFPNANIRFIGGAVFEGCKNLKTVVLPNKLFEIGVGAFAGCSSLENITIPSNVTEIDYDAFVGCSSLMQITCNAPTAPSIGTSSMYHTFTVPKYGTLYYPAGSDYSTWLNKKDKVYNLGHYEWNGVEVHPDGEILTPDTTMEISADGETFKYTIEAEHIQTYIQCRFSNFISVERIDMYNFNITVQANDGNERQGEVYFEYQDYNGNILNHILTITQDEKYIPDGEIVTPNKTMEIGGDGKTFQYTIETINIKNISSYYITDNYGNRYLDTIDGFISMEMVNMNNFNITVEENEGDERRCGIYFQYMDYNGNQLTHRLSIFQDAKPEEEPEEPDVPTYPDGEITVYGPWDTFPYEEYRATDLFYVEYQNLKNIIPQSDANWCICTVSINEPPSFPNGFCGFDVAVSENTSSESRTCNVTIYGVDMNNNNITATVKITQDAKPEEEPDVPPTPPTPDEPEEPTYIEPEIRLYKTRLDYASDGGDKTVQIDYYGATTILEPTCTQSWVTIKKTGSGWYEEDGVRVDQHQYKITMQPSLFARNTNVTFSCTDVNGVVFEDSHLMLYQSAPVATPTIVVSKNNISLDNVGDTSVIQVTYINVDEIVPPEVGDGFTIEEIERVESENGIQVKYKVTRISPKRQNAQINFKGNNTSSGESATSGNVTIKGEPVPAEFLVQIWPYEGETLIVGDPNNDCSLKLYVYGYTGQYNFSYEINGDSSAIFVKNEEVWDSEDEAAHVYFTLELDAFPNNTNNSFIGTIDLTYTDEINNYNTSVPFKVRHANEGRIESNISRYNYDKDGNNTYSNNNNYFAIRYYNLTTINPVECDVDWIQIGNPELKSNENDDHIKYHYTLSVQPNSGFSRKGYVTFSGIGVDGNTYSLELEINQEGEEVVKPIDIGFIELQQLSVVLNADGGAQTFQVKYYDTITVNPPELAGTWATITEVSRTEPVPDVAWNGEECESFLITYRATAQPTESGRQMKVTFTSEINGYNGSVINMWNDKFIVYQLAEGSTEVQGDVAILRYSNTFTYYGSPTGWDFRVAYKNVVPDTPLISETWCRIKEVNELQADEYDYYKEYILDMDTNNSTLSRICTITFIGNAEDGSQIKIPFQFTQQGQEEIVNEGEYANYKGYFMDFEGALHSVSFITNPRIETYGDIRLAGDSPVVVSYAETDTLYEPIRTSTCTVKVVSSHYLMNLYSGKAQGTQVILRNEDRDTIEWCGFLQPNLYNQGFTECIEEIEFEASDCLSTLQYLRYEYEYAGNGQPMIVSFKEIVDSIAEKCKLINSYIFSQRLFSNSDESKIFDFKEFYISENNFYSEEGEPWTYQEVLEELCKYFGYVCFQWGDKIYFMDYDKYQSNKTMVGYKYSKDDRWYNRSYITISNPNRITEESYRGTGADISLDDVFNKVTVNCNYYNLEHLLPDLFEDDLLTERNALSITGLVNRGQEVGHKAEYIVYDHKNIKSHFYKPIVGESIHEVEAEPTEDDFKKKSFFKDFVGGNIVDMYYLNYSDLKGKTFESKEWEKYLMISQLNRPWCTGPIVGEYDTTKYWENYNFPIMEFTQIPQIFIDNHKEVYESNTTTGGRVPSTRAGFGTSSSTPNSRPSINTNKSEHYFLIRAEAAFTPHFSEAYVPENVDETGFGKWSNSEYVGYYFDRIANTTKKEQNFAPKLTFYLEIPTAGWWNGEKWVDYETWFEVPLEELHYSDELWYTWKNTQNKVQTNLFLGKSGYKIQLPEDMESTAFMQFKIGMPKRFAHVSGGDDNGEAGNAYCFIKNLEVDIVSRNTSLIKDEDIVYENVIDDNNVVDGPEIDLKITSDNNITYSFSTVSTKYGEDMINTTNFRFYDKEGEMILPEEAIIEKYVNQYSTPTLKENVIVDMSFTPSQMITDTYWDKDFVIVGQEIDYQMCRQEITLLEKK